MPQSGSRILENNTYLDLIISASSANLHTINKHFPEVGKSNPLMTLANVVLPAPLPPLER